MEETHVEEEPDEDLGPALALAHRGCTLFYPSVGGDNEHLACNDVRNTCGLIWDI